MIQPINRYILQWSKSVTPRVQHYSFIREDREKIIFTPGQYITLNIKNITDPSKTLHRSYSIANGPGRDSLEIACTNVEGGIATSYLRGLKPGDPLLISGPYGHFVLNPSEQISRTILMATGTGVAPYRSMLDDFEKRFQNSNLEVILIAGVRNKTEILFAEEFRNFSEKNPRFKFYVCYSQERNMNFNEFERFGHVQDVLSEIHLEPQEDIVYLSGNPNMIDSVFEALITYGFDQKNIRQEKYSFAQLETNPA